MKTMMLGASLLLAMTMSTGWAEDVQPSPVSREISALHQRSVVPIHEVPISPEAIPQYAITVIVNGQRLEAGLDTGSVGLRLLPRAVKQSGIWASGSDDLYGYGSGVTLHGPDAPASVQIGDLKQAIPVQAVQVAGCRGASDSCPAGELSPAQYGLMGSGFAGKGFPAILGIRLEPGRLPNPLVGLGAERWIVHIPQRGAGEGSLILNPNAADVEGFVPLQSKDDPAGSVDGCVAVARPGARQICSAMLWDTGAPAISVRNAPRPPSWQPGAPIEMSFTTESGSRLPAIAFRAGDVEHGARTTFSPAPNRPGIHISAGLLPFYAYDVLYNATTGAMAVRANTGDYHPSPST